VVLCDDPELRQIQIEHNRSLTPEQRFQQMLDLNEFVKQQQLLEIRALYPEADEFEIKIRLASRWVRNLDLLKEAFGWDVKEKGF
jgi:hypothetical protein